MQLQRRNRLSQNFLHDRKLVKDLVGKSSIVKTDRAVEIGPGKGIVTSELLEKSATVVAVELDRELVRYLKGYFAECPKFWLMEQDILDFQLPSNEYKVFSNIPFAIEGEIVRKLLDNGNPPRDSYLVIRRELAERLSGIPHDNKFSLKHKPWFDFSMIHYFKRSDFVPQTKVDAVLWRIEKRTNPGLSISQRKDWERFIDAAVGKGENLRKNLIKVLSKGEVGSMAAKLQIDPDIKPTYLGFDKWIWMYRYLKEINRL